MSLIGIIGGTGVCDTTMLKNVRQEKLLTFFGMIHYLRGTYKDKEIVFLPRHGRTHSIPPHLINYRANILGLKKLGVSAIFSTILNPILWRVLAYSAPILPRQAIKYFFIE